MNEELRLIEELAEIAERAKIDYDLRNTEYWGASRKEMSADEMVRRRQAYEVASTVWLTCERTLSAVTNPSFRQPPNAPAKPAVAPEMAAEIERLRAALNAIAVKANAATDAAMDDPEMCFDLCLDNFDVIITMAADAIKGDAP